MWNVEVKMIPIIIGATGSLPLSFQKYVEDITGKHSGMEQQKTAIVETARNFIKTLTQRSIHLECNFQNPLCHEPQGQYVTQAHEQIPSKIVSVWEIVIILHLS
jgi:hypothetical protein